MGPQTKVEKKLEMLRVAGAIANYRLITSQNRAAVEVQPGDSLTGDDLRQFVVQMIGDDLEPDQISVVETQVRKTSEIPASSIGTVDEKEEDRYSSNICWDWGHLHSESIETR